MEIILIDRVERQIKELQESHKVVLKKLDDIEKQYSHVIKEVDKVLEELKNYA